MVKEVGFGMRRLEECRLLEGGGCEGHQVEGCAGVGAEREYVLPPGIVEFVENVKQGGEGREGERRGVMRE